MCGIAQPKGQTSPIVLFSRRRTELFAGLNQENSPHVSWIEVLIGWVIHIVGRRFVTYIKNINFLLSVLIFNDFQSTKSFFGSKNMFCWDYSTFYLKTASQTPRNGNLHPSQITRSRLYNRLGPDSQQPRNWSESRRNNITMIPLRNYGKCLEWNTLEKFT